MQLQVTKELPYRKCADRSLHTSHAGFDRSKTSLKFSSNTTALHCSEFAMIVPRLSSCIISSLFLLNSIRILTFSARPGICPASSFPLGRNHFNSKWVPLHTAFQLYSSNVLVYIMTGNNCDFLSNYSQIFLFN